MGSLTIVEKGADCQEAIDYPAFYMNDFSLLGLRVENLTRALDLLETDGYAVQRKTCTATGSKTSLRPWRVTGSAIACRTWWGAHTRADRETTLPGGQSNERPPAKRVS